MILRQKNKEIVLSQERYNERLEKMEISDLEERMEEREQTEFRSRVGQLNWMSQSTRPDM